MGYIDVDWDKIGRDAIKPLDTVSTAHSTTYQMQMHVMQLYRI
jgi:hypothetical protein